MLRTSPVVVGYDGSGRALAALTWAAREAAERGLELRIVQVTPYAGTMSPRRPSAQEDRPNQNQVLDDGIRLARRLMGDAPMTATCIAGHPAGVLAGESEHAALVVVGQRSQDAPVSSAVGSTSMVLADKAHCPVVVARGAVGPERCVLPVAVGVTGDPSSRTALDFAAYTAQIRGVPLTVVVAWSLPPAREWPHGTHGFDTPAQRVRDVLARAAAVAGASEDHLRRHYPAVAIQTRVERADAATALERASRRAGLLVLGAREDSDSSSGAGALGQGWGQVVRDALGRAACPVAVVPSVS